MLDNLTNRFSKVLKNIRGQSTLTEDNIKEALREVRLALLEADVALPVVKEFVNTVKEQALGQEVVGSLTPDQAFIGVVNQALVELMGKENKTLDLSVSPPAIVLMAGLQGAGKTTTVGKLARLLKNDQKKKVLVVSADVYRPAAIEQLRLLAEQVGVDFFPSDTNQKPVEIATAAVDYAKKAKDGKIALEDLTGGTFSITNGGTFGSMMSTPIINPPQSAILGMHATKERAVVENGQVVVRPMMYLALSYDHRIIDGREAVLTLVAIKDALEDPARLLLDL